MSGWVARLILLSGALAMGAPLSVSATQPRRTPGIGGCWEQTSHPPLVKARGSEEWGSRSWCFAGAGKLISRTVACGSGSGCDGWESEHHYRWRPPFLSISDVETSSDGKQQTNVWRKCRIRFLTADWMQLQDCDLSLDPWTRER